MFVFPLGLQAKTRDFPWMTLIILVSTSVYSVLCFESSRQARQLPQSGPIAIERVQKQKRLAIASCPLSNLDQAECRIFLEIAKPERLETERQFAYRIHSDRAVKDLRRERRALFTAYAMQSWRHPSQEVRELAAFAAFLPAQVAEDEMLANHAKENSILTKASFGFLPLLRSQFLHADWEHLLGNMVFLLLFAIPLEQRVGALGFLMIYLIGGSTGLTLDLFFSAEPTRAIVGASANISAIAAAFMIAFWSLSVRVWVSLFFVVNQIVRVPTWMFFAAFVLAQDVTGALGVKDDGVAHLAHLGGFGIGCLLGAIAVQISLLPKPFAFPYELKMFLDSRRITDLDVRLGRLLEILEYNPFNTVVVVESWKIIYAQPDKGWDALPKSAQRFLQERFCELLIALHSSEKKQMQELLETAQTANWPWAILIPIGARPSLMNLARQLESTGESRGAAIVVQLLINSDPSSSEARLLEKSVIRKGLADERQSVA